MAIADECIARRRVRRATRRDGLLVRDGELGRSPRLVATSRPIDRRLVVARCAMRDARVRMSPLARAVEVVDSSTHAVGVDDVDVVVVVDIVLLLLHVDGGRASFADALGLRTRDRGVRTRRTRARTYIERIAAVRSRVCDVDDRATHGFIGLNTKPTPRRRRRR